MGREKVQASPALESRSGLNRGNHRLGGTERDSNHTEQAQYKNIEASEKNGFEEAEAAKKDREGKSLLPRESRLAIPAISANLPAQSSIQAGTRPCHVWNIQLFKPQSEFCNLLATKTSGQHLITSRNRIVRGGEVEVQVQIVGR